MFKFHDAIKNLAGATEARQLVVSESLEYLNSLADEASDDPSLQRELAEAYQRLGEIQGLPGKENLGDKAAALVSFKKAVAIRESLVASVAASIGDQLGLARSYSDLSRIVGAPENTEYANKALKIHETLLAAHPENEKVRSEAGISYHNAGLRLSGAGDFAGALENYRKTQAIYKALWEGEPTNPGYRRDFAHGCKRVGAVLIRTGDLNAAAENYRRALELEDASIAADPNNASIRLDLSFTLSDLGFILRKQKDYAGALQNTQRSLAIREELSAADPKDIRARVALATSHGKIATILEETEDYAGALDHYQKGLEIKEALAAANPADTSLKADVAECLLWIGGAHEGAASKPTAGASERRRHWQEARSAYQRALDISSGMVSKGLKVSAECQPDNLAKHIAKCEAESKTK